MSLASETAAARDTVFQDMCGMAAAQTAVNVYSEATTLNANLVSGTAITSIPVTPNLGSGITAGTVIAINGDTFVATTTASGASAIGCNSQAPSKSHFVGEFVTPPSPVSHAVRAQLATKVLNDPESYRLRFAWACASQGDTSATPDVTIINHVSAVWNDIAGA